MTQPILGFYFGNGHLYAGNGHVFGALMMPKTNDRPPYTKLLSFDGAKFQNDEIPMTHGILVPITHESAKRIEDMYAEIERAVKEGRNPFYFTVDGRPLAKFEPRVATNCAHSLLSVCEQAGIPLDEIAEDLTPTFDTKILQRIIDEETNAFDSISMAGTTGKLKEVYVPRQRGPEILFFQHFTPQPMTHGFDRMVITTKSTDGVIAHEPIITYLSKQNPLGLVPPIPNTVVDCVENRADLAKSRSR